MQGLGKIKTDYVKHKYSIKITVLYTQAISVFL